MNRFQKTKFFIWLNKKHATWTKDDSSMTFQYTALLITCVYFTYTGDPALPKQPLPGNETITYSLSGTPDVKSVLMTTTLYETNQVKVSFAKMNTLENPQDYLYSAVFPKSQSTLVNCYLHGTLSKVYYLKENTFPKFSFGYLNSHAALQMK